MQNLETANKARLVRFPEVINRTAKSRSRIYAEIELGIFPRPIKLGPKSIAWLESEIDEYINNLIAHRNKGGDHETPA
jgi:prophage regulatory protein